MGLVVNHNMMAMAAARNLGAIYGKLAVSTARLSSGLRVNSAADDAAGLAVRETMRADIAVLNQGVRNAGDAISLIQTAEGALAVVDEKLIRMKELAEQAATGTYTSDQRAIMDSEYQQMASEIDRIATATDFNGVKLLDGSLSTLNSNNGLKIHFGTGNSSAEDYYYINIGNLKATPTAGLGVGGSQNLADVWTYIEGEASTETYVGSNNGILAFQMNTDVAASTIEVDEWFGFYETTSATTLSGLGEMINAGPAARLTMYFAACASIGMTFVIGNEQYEVVCATSGHAPSADGIHYIGASIGGTEASFASVFASQINEVATGEFWAVTSGAYMTLYNRNPGPAGNTLYAYASEMETTTDVTFGCVGALNAHKDAANKVYFAHGNESWATASLETGGSGYRLTITGDLPGAQYDIDFSHAASIASGDDGAGILYNSGKTAVGAYDKLDGDDTGEWSNTQDAAAGNAGGSIETQARAQEALAEIDSAIAEKDNTRAYLGGLQNRLENTITNLTVQAENLQAAESRVSDVDVALEMTEFTKNNILVQAAVAMLAQANTLPTLALTLLGGV